MKVFEPRWNRTADRSGPAGLHYSPVAPIYLFVPDDGLGPQEKAKTHTDKQQQ
jgi:hypothetical protein